MGCGVSKKDIREPSRIQTVVVNVGSPESHLKAHEASLQQNHDLVCLVGTHCQGPYDKVNNIDPNNPLLQSSNLTLNDGLQPLVESPRAEDDNLKEESIEDLRQPTLMKKPPCDETPQVQEAVQDSPLSCSSNGLVGSPSNETPQVQQVVPELPLICSSNGLVGTLAGLDEILGTQEACSLKLAIKVTAEKIMSYGGVLHSLEDQVGSFPYPLQCSGDTSIELQHQEEGQEILGLTAGNYDRIASPIFTRSPKPTLESFRKKLPPLFTPNSSLIDESSIVDPFVKTPFPIHCQPRIMEIQDLAEEAPPLSPQLSHTTELVAVDNVKDILVMDGASCNYEKGRSPPSITLWEGLNCDVGNNITLLETLDAQDTTDGDYGSTHVHRCYDNMSVSDPHPELGGRNGVNNTCSPWTPFSTSSHRVEYMGEAKINTPLSSDEFYS